MDICTLGEWFKHCFLVASHAVSTSLLLYINERNHGDPMVLLSTVRGASEYSLAVVLPSLCYASLRGQTHIYIHHEIRADSQSQINNYIIADEIRVSLYAFATPTGSSQIYVPTPLASWKKQSVSSSTILFSNSTDASASTLCSTIKKCLFPVSH